MLLRGYLDSRHPREHEHSHPVYTRIDSPFGPVVKGGFAQVQTVIVIFTAVFCSEFLPGKAQKLCHD